MNGRHRMAAALDEQARRAALALGAEARDAGGQAGVGAHPASRADGAHGGAGVGTRVALARVSPKGPQEDPK